MLREKDRIISFLCIDSVYRKQKFSVLFEGRDNPYNIWLKNLAPRVGLGHELLIRFAHKYSRPRLGNDLRPASRLRLSSPTDREKSKDPMLTHRVSTFSSSASRTRTYDQALNRRPLYQLSYRGI